MSFQTNIMKYSDNEAVRGVIARLVMILLSASCSLWYLDNSECRYLSHHYHSARAMLYLSVGLFPNIFSCQSLKMYQILFTPPCEQHHSSPFSNPHIFQEEYLLGSSPGPCITTTFVNQELLNDTPYGIH